MMNDTTKRHVFSQRLWNAYVSKGLRMVTLAEAAGVPYDRVHAFVKREALPTEHEIHRLATALNVAPSALCPWLDV